MDVFEMIEAQQKGLEMTAPWMVGEQLKDICRREPDCAAIVAEDLQNKDMGLAACEKEIKAWADKHRKSNCAVVPPDVAEDIIRKFYGLPGRSEEPTTPTKQTQEPEVLDLFGFL